MPQLNILLVEDDPNVASFILRGLQEAGYKVSVAPDGNSGFQMARQYDFDILVVDVMLPGMNGIDICKNLRAQGNDTPLLMLTALGSTENIITGLDSGADDYLVKPFKFAELLARIRTLTRRGPKNMTPAANMLQIADLQLNLDSREVTRNGQLINLTSTEFKLLHYLMQNPRRTLTRIDILEHVWDIDFNMGTNVVDVYVNYLRKKIDKNFDTRLIQTVVGVGYMLKEGAAHENK